MSKKKVEKYQNLKKSQKSDKTFFFFKKSEYLKKKKSLPKKSAITLVLQIEEISLQPELSRLLRF